jgi:ribosomal protein S12 methylthiotransferase accessory factor
MNSMLARAADFLVAGATKLSDPDKAPVLNFLGDLDYLPSDRCPHPDQETVLHRSRLLRAAARMSRLFILPTRQAPKLIIMGGEASASILSRRFEAIPTGSMTGSGTCLREAFEACVGEGVEYLSQFEQPEDQVNPERGARLVDPFPTATSPLPRLDQDGHVAGTRLLTGEEIFLPRYRCVRTPVGHPKDIPPFTLGTGCGAGASFDAATLHGLFELIERDATALWWRGGRFAKPISTNEHGLLDAKEFLSALRGAVSERLSWFLDITTDLGIPCAAAISVDMCGQRIACGTACRIGMGAALKSAIREMCQMELAYDVVEAKERERGEAALNATDLRHKKRSTAINAWTSELLHTRGKPARQTPVVENEEVSAVVLMSLVRHLENLGVQVLAVDLTRGIFEIPVVRVVAPELQLDPCDITTRRLKKHKDETWRVNKVIPLV